MNTSARGRQARSLRRSFCKLFAILVALAVATTWLLFFQNHSLITELANQVPAKPTVAAAAPHQLLLKDTSGSDAYHSRSYAPGAEGTMHFITVQTNPSPPWCRMLHSALLTGNVSVVNLAWGAKYAHILRPRWILEFLESVRDSDVVLFADGGDTIFTGVDGNTVYQSFAAMTAPSEKTFDETKVASGDMLSPVLFNAEANCYHQQTFSGSWGVKKGKCLAAYKRYAPNVSSPYRYLNGGAWIARVWAAKKVFLRAQQIIAKNSKLWCDQSVLGGVLLSGVLRGILDLDRDNRYFLPTYHLRPQRDFCSSTSTWVQMKMCHSNFTPAVVHFNGKSEGHFTSDVIRRSGWYGRYRHMAAGGKNEVLANLTRRSTMTSWSRGKLVSEPLKKLCPSDSFPS